MGILDGIGNFVKNQFLEVIDWSDNTNDTLVWKFEDNNKEINMGAQLTVRESQLAIFMNEGKIADVFSPGMHKLSTSTMPVLTALKSWKHGFSSPFRSEIYFVSTKQFTDQKWGTANPVMMRDKDFGMIRLRGFGVYAFKVTDPKKLLIEVAGTKNVFKVSDINEQIKKTVVSSLFDAIATSQVAALDLAMRYEEIGDQTAANLNQKFNPIGISISSLVIENISLPDEVEKALDKRTSMGAIGNLNNYTQFQAAEAIGNMGKKEGASNPAFDMGAGLAMSQMMVNSMNNQNANAQPPQPSAAPAVSASSSASACSKCQTPLASGAKFCSSCGQPVPKNIFCSNCGKPLTPSSKFCPECGAKA